jgi:hypothetical protein
LFSQRTRILEVKFDFLSEQIIERIEIRRRNLESLLHEEVSIDTKIMSTDGPSASDQNSGTSNLPLYLRLLDVSRERRSQDIDCWRDLVHVFKDILIIWEDLEQSKVRDAMLYDVPLPYGGEKNQ